MFLSRFIVNSLDSTYGRSLIFSQSEIKPPDVSPTNQFVQRMRYICKKKYLYFWAPGPKHPSHELHSRFTLE